MRPKGRVAPPPAYRQRTGYDQAIVTLTDAATGKRRDYWLGTFGTAESREAYHRLIAEWEISGRRFPDRPVVKASPTSPGALPVSELIRQYWRWAKEYYSATCVYNVRMALRVLREHFGSTDAAIFGPNSLRIVRDAMVLGRATAEKPRAAWCRKTANTRVGDIVRMFRWAASRELVGPQVYQALQTLPPLKRGRSGAVDHDPVQPVAVELVEAVKPHVSRQVAALIDLQLLTGARPGELLKLRACEIDTAGEGAPSRLRAAAGTPRDGGSQAGNGTVWAYRPAQHKNTYRGKSRTIYFGPQAQQILAPFMAERPLDAFLFSPAEADRERRQRLSASRKTPLSCGNRRGIAKRVPGGQRFRDHYTRTAYRKAIERGTDKAFPPPPHLRPEKRAYGWAETEVQMLERLTPQQRAELKAWRDQHRWHPNQLRHTAATLIRREFGLEAAQLVLGHSSAMITDAVYAERDAGKIAEVIRRVG